MTLALFDLDNTLLDGDSDYEWGQFLVRKGLVDGPSYTAKNLEFYEQYKAGILNIYDFARFSLTPISKLDDEALNTLHQEYMATVIRPKMTPKAVDLVNQHRAQGHTLMVITATNSVVTRPIAKAFGIEHLIATEPKRVNGRYTTDIDGVASFQMGKVTRLQDWLKNHTETLEDSYFYSDSHNDIPLLEMVTYPVVVNPDPRLNAVAKERAWPIIDLHDRGLD
ncbi:MAG: HAD family hydrolase [Thiofilum sp.]|uniref:histidinol-phosphatase n=1 Tax=Thiofilum sp. TaxID=2212733 RepID=UPI0025D673E0|nr:HAD family hydrolase [Thiofilum sp.]MBK8453574.1 HAD family hydrolase [Thiofilum sp.]